MTITKLEELLSQSENEKLDFKLEFNLDREHTKKEFIKDVTAIANSKGGRGYIIFGVKDKTKEIVGVEPKKYDEERVQQLICGRSDPPVPVRLEEIMYKNKKILVLTIFKSIYQPHQVIQTGTFYIRRGSTTDVARRSEIAGMLQENGLLSYETTALLNSRLQDLDFNTLSNLLDKKISIHNSKNLLILEAMGIITKNHESDGYIPTAGGMLLFGKNPQLFMPHTGIKIQFNNHSTLINGNIPLMLDEVEKVINPIFSETTYPVKAVLEAIYNSIVHRDYWDFSRETLVVIEDKRIEIVNPGAVWAKEGNLKFDNEPNLPRRNSWLYQRLLILDKKQRFLNNFVGLQNISQCFENCATQVKFINLPKKNLFKVVLPGIKEI